MSHHFRSALPLYLFLALVIANHCARAAQWQPAAGVPAISLGQPGGPAQLDGSGTASSFAVVPNGGSALRTLVARTGDAFNLREFGPAAGGW